MAYTDYSKTFRDAKESAENLIIVKGEGDDYNRPDYECPAYKDLSKRMAYIRACYGGTETMREEGQQLLPKMAREEDWPYKQRLMRSIAYNAVKRTAGGLAGMIFRKDLNIEATDAQLSDLEDVDLLGNDIDAFARFVVEDAMRDGYGWILVDAPAQAAANRDEEVRRGLRPYWVHVDAMHALNWRYSMVDGKPELELFVYKEIVTEDAGAFGQQMIERYRVLRPGSYEVWEKRKGENNSMRFERVDEGQLGVDFVPVVFVPSLASTPEDSRPVLCDIADYQVAWYQRWSMYNIALDYAVPMPVVIGEKADNIEFGPSSVLFIPDPEGDAKYLEMAGSAIEANREQMKDLEGAMAMHGLSMLQRETRAAETAEAKRIDKSESDSQLSVIAKALEGALNQALWYTAQYVRGSEPATVSVNRDFMSQQLDSATVQVLSNMVMLGQLSLDTLWQTLVQGEVLPDGFDAEVEREGLDAGELGMGGADTFEAEGGGI